MNLPQIDLSSLPDLETLTGLFGCVRRGHDDTIVLLATFVFEAGA